MIEHDEGNFLCHQSLLASRSTSHDRAGGVSWRKLRLTPMTPDLTETRLWTCLGSNHSDSEVRTSIPPTSTLQHPGIHDSGHSDGEDQAYVVCRLAASYRTTICGLRLRHGQTLSGSRSIGLFGRSIASEREKS